MTAKLIQFHRDANRRHQHRPRQNATVAHSFTRKWAAAVSLAAAADYCCKMRARAAQRAAFIIHFGHGHAAG